MYVHDYRIFYIAFVCPNLLLANATGKHIIGALELALQAFTEEMIGCKAVACSKENEDAVSSGTSLLMYSYAQV